MTTKLVLPEPTAEIATVASNTSTLVTLADSLVVASSAEMANGTDLLAQIKALLKRSEAARDVLVRPLNEHVRMINAQFKTVTEPLAGAERTIKAKMLAFAVEQERRAHEEAQRLHREAQERALAEIVNLDEAGETVAAEVALSFAVAAKPDEVRAEATTTLSGNTASVRKVWDFELTDIAKVPKGFLALDEAKVREAIRGGVRDIPGIRIYQKESLAIRGAR